MGLDFRIVIPARYQSQRLPGKALRLIRGKPMIEWVYRAAQASPASQIIVATDDQRIADTVIDFGGEVCMTAAHHRSGTDRIVEVTQVLKWRNDDIVVNLQGDEPLMPAQNLTQVARNLAHNDCAMATLHKSVDAIQAEDPNLVKLVQDNDHRVLYFSRSRIPYSNDKKGQEYLGHIGLYAYRVGFINSFSALEPGQLERAESLEQLRALCNGYTIHSEIAQVNPGPGVDTEADLTRVEQIMASASS